MRLCPRCSARFRGSNQTRDGFDDLDADYDLFDEELDALIDEAIQRPAIRGGRRGAVRRTLSPWPRLLRLAEGAIRSALNAFNTGRGPGVVSNAIYQGEQALRQAGAEIRRVTGGAGRSSVLEPINALSSINIAVSRLQAARDRLHMSMSPAVPLTTALEWIGHARRAIGLRVA